MRQNNYEPAPCGVVGIVDSVASLRACARLPVGAVDFLEWRADCLPESKRPRSAFPWILTVRDPAEGGKNGLSPAERRDAFLRLLDGSAFIDIECANLRTFQDIVGRAGVAKIPVIGSFHDFEKTPPRSTLSRVITRAVDDGADLVKIAVTTSTPADVATLLELLDKSVHPLALMGMGRLGMASRVVLGAAGSVLNYGWLHRPNVPGQWSARELRRLIARAAA